MLLSDEDLVRSYAAGEPGSFDQLYARYKDPLFRYCCFVLRNRTRAEDILQKAFLRFIENAESLARNRTLRFKPWMYRVTANLCKDELKRSENRFTVSVDDMGLMASTHDGHELDLEKLDLEKAIDQAIRVLPEKARQVIGLHYYSGLDHASIARILKIPIGTVKSRMSKASETLARLLKGRKP